jgi:hypothetical protein
VTRRSNNQLNIAHIDEYGATTFAMTCEALLEDPIGAYWRPSEVVSMSHGEADVLWVAWHISSTYTQCGNGAGIYDSGVYVARITDLRSENPHVREVVVRGLMRYSLYGPVHPPTIHASAQSADAVVVGQVVAQGSGYTLYPPVGYNDVSVYMLKLTFTTYVSVAVTSYVGYASAASCTANAALDVTCAVGPGGGGVGAWRLERFRGSDLASVSNVSLAYGGANVSGVLVVHDVYATDDLWVVMRVLGDVDIGGVSGYVNEWGPVAFKVRGMSVVAGVLVLSTTSWPIGVLSASGDESGGLWIGGYLNWTDTRLTIGGMFVVSEGSGLPLLVHVDGGGTATHVRWYARGERDAERD